MIAKTYHVAPCVSFSSVVNMPINYNVTKQRTMHKLDIVDGTIVMRNKEFDTTE